MGGAISLISHFFDQSFWIPSPQLTENNLPSQSGKVFIITGANCGVGYELASILYSQHATVYLACRSQDKAKDAIERITARHSDSQGKLRFLELDLSDLATIKTAATNFLSQEKRLDWLNHNAGISLPPLGLKSKQGHELQYATHVLGPFLLTKLLLPILQQTAQTEPRDSVRVTWASSIVMEIQAPTNGIDFDTEGNPKDHGMDNYALSKVGDFWLANEFGSRTDAVLHLSYNPGNLDSSILRHQEKHLGRWFPILMRWTFLFPPILGAYTELYAGVGQDLSIERDQGGYVIPWGRRLLHQDLRKDLIDNIGPGKGSEQLWDWCERETGQYA